MQTRLLIALLIVSSNLLYAQEVISSNGEDGVGPTFHYTYTVGEPVIETGLAGNNYLTQGFNQPNDECYVNTQFDVTSCNTYLWNGNQYSTTGVYIDTINNPIGCDSILILNLTLNDGITAPITLELLLDDYCVETFWNVKDSRDTVIYSGQNYNCNPAGGGPQANTLIIENMNLAPNECYTFELGDVYGDGLGASFWGGIDGSWLLKDFNNIIIGQGQGNFGFLIEYSFYVDQSNVTNVIGDGDLQTGVYIYPNPTKENITISIENFNGNIQTEVYDLIGHRLQTTNETTISLRDYARGIYLLKVTYGDRVEEVKVIKE